MLTHIITTTFFQYSEHLLGVETLIVVPKRNLMNSAVAGNRSISMVSTSFTRQEAKCGKGSQGSEGVKRWCLKSEKWGK